ncbi:MAG: metallophosphatase domain-containing protein [Lentimicrobiaceae bacterium]|nr:metallophosphatase domain-containing protein [Lentimicrobiaceae bacterium]
MKILHISDTHSKHHLVKKLPKADIIVHSGDATEDGTESKMLDFLNWFCDLDFRHKIFVAGNHDLCLDGEQIENLSVNCHYLCYSGVEIEGVKFWGFPYFLSNELNGDTAQFVAQIPNETDVLITHQPPYGILDFDDGNNFGRVDLLQALPKIRPKYHLFGHVHAGYGTEKSQHTTFINASLVRKNKIVNEPFLLEI